MEPDRSLIVQISGFTFVRNADSLYYPIRESILSALPVVDEFIVALGECQDGDRTRELIDSIESDKVKVIETVWDLNAYPNGTENAHQTDIAKSHASGDWCLYLQADEVLHENDHDAIRHRCTELIDDAEVEGLLFRYNHFWGDYWHVQRSHGWYQHEIRIVRNDPDIHSWESAQSFRMIHDFDGKSYRQKEGTRKLNVAAVDASIYHYGWARPPAVMKRKQVALDTIHKGEEAIRASERRTDSFDYGPLDKVSRFRGSHPAVMAQRIKEFDWERELRTHADAGDANRPLHKHERLKYRALTWLEKNLANGSQIGGFKNYNVLSR